MASPEQVAANIRNSAKSSGPSPQGKEASKRNGLKHGLTGEGIVLTPEDEANVVSLHDELQADMRPQSKLGRELVGRLALMLVRLDKCSKRESAATAIRVRNSTFTFEDARRAEVEALFAKLDADPIDGVRKLIRTPEGTLRLIKGLNALRDKLTRTDRVTWSQFDHDHLERHAGREPAPFGSELYRLARAIQGDLSRLETQEGGGLDDVSRKACAVGQMLERVDVELAVHQTQLESFGPDFAAMERAEAADLALIGTSKEEIRDHKYEAAAERSLFKTLKEYHEAEAKGDELEVPDATTENVEACEELASSLPAPSKAKPGRSPKPKQVETGRPKPRTEEEISASRALARERELRAMR
jgi:hypothetical protein